MNFQRSRVWRAGDNREGLSKTYLLLPAGWMQWKTEGGEGEVCTWAIDLNDCPRGSPAGTTTDPCSHRTKKGELNPKSYRINEKGNSGYLLILPIAQSSFIPNCLVCHLKPSVDGLLRISPTSSSCTTGRGMIPSSFPLRHQSEGGHML